MDKAEGGLVEKKQSSQWSEVQKSLKKGYTGSHWAKNKNRKREVEFTHCFRGLSALPKCSELQLERKSVRCSLTVFWQLMNILLVSQSYCEETKFIWVKNSEIFIHMPLSYYILALTIKVLILHIYSKKAEITGLPKVLRLPCYLLFLRYLKELSPFSNLPLYYIFTYTHMHVHVHTHAKVRKAGDNIYT